MLSCVFAGIASCFGLVRDGQNIAKTIPIPIYYYVV